MGITFKVFLATRKGGVRTCLTALAGASSKAARLIPLAASRVPIGGRAGVPGLHFLGGLSGLFKHLESWTILRPGVFNDQLHRACAYLCMYVRYLGSCEHLRNTGKHQTLFWV